MGYAPHDVRTVEEMIKVLQTEYEIVSKIDQDEAESGAIEDGEIQFNNGWASGMVRAIQLLKGENWDWDGFHQT